MTNEKTAEKLLEEFTEILSRRGTVSKKLKSLYESCHIDQDLTVGLDNYFHIAVTLWLSLKKAEKGNFYCLSYEDNIGIDELYNDKKFIHKSFEIIKMNNRRHVLKTSCLKFVTKLVTKNF